MNNVYKKFNSVIEFTKYLETGTVQPYFVGHEDSKQTNEPEWAGTKNYEEAEYLLSYGDKENAALIEQGVAKERAQLKPSHRRQICTSVVGVAPHVPNYCAGVPNSMINYRTKKLTAKILNVAVNISVSGSVSPNEMINAAVKMLSAVLRIEASGIKVNLYVCSAAEKNGQHIGWIVKLKSSQEKLDVLRTAYPLLNPSMLRRHDFRFVEVTEGINQRFVNSYGRVFAADELLKSTGIKDAVELNYYQCKYLCIEDIVKKITGQK